MATGAGDQYWGQPGLPTVFKHDLLCRYLPVFSGKTGSQAASVVYLDGYAGRGRYDDGTPASAELILQIAENQNASGIHYRIFFYEPDGKSYAILKTVVDEYVARGAQAEASQEEVSTGLSKVIEAARDLPLFLFLDPCGLGVPFSVLTSTLSGPRAAQWPPTEVFLNFSLEAVRRIAGHLTSSTPNEKTMVRLDEALGGTWWRDLVRQHGADQAPDEIVQGFVERLSQAANMGIFAIPVRRAPRQKPIYYLVFGTRNPLGLWHFADATARATEKWWSTLDARGEAKQEAIGQGSLFDEPISMRTWDLSTVEAEARPVIGENIASLCTAHGSVRMRDYPAEIFGDYLGRVRETVVRAAIKDLHKAGRTTSDGVGRRIADLVVTPPR